MSRIYQGRIVDLHLERVALPNGTVVDLEVIHHVGAAAVAAADEQGRTVLIRQYRHAAGGFIWELPAGLLAPGETPAACAGRELREEPLRAPEADAARVLGLDHDRQVDHRQIPRDLRTRQASVCARRAPR